MTSFTLITSLKAPVQSQSEVLGLALPVFVFAFGLQ